MKFFYNPIALKNTRINLRLFVVLFISLWSYNSNSQIDCTAGGVRTTWNSTSGRDDNNISMTAGVDEDTEGTYGPYTHNSRCLTSGPWGMTVDISAPAMGAFNSASSSISGGTFIQGVDAAGGNTFCYSFTNAAVHEIGSLIRIYPHETLTITASLGGTPVSLTATETNATYQANMIINGGAYTAPVSATTLTISASTSFTRVLNTVSDGPIDQLCIEYSNDGTSTAGHLGQTQYVIYACAVASAAENTTARCTNGADDDCDGLVDCEDPDCENVPSPALENTIAECSDGIDNDCDGLIDCEDDSCLPVAEDVGCIDLLDCSIVEGVQTRTRSIGLVSSESLMDLDSDGTTERLTTALVTEEGEYGTFISNLCVDDGDASSQGDLLLWDLTVGSRPEGEEFNSTSSRVLNNAYMRQGTEIGVVGENQFCYTFSSNVKLQINNVGAHGDLDIGEAVIIEAFDESGAPVTITGLEPASSNTTGNLTINGMPSGAMGIMGTSLTFENDSNAGRGRWAAFSNTPVASVCITYVTDGTGTTVASSIEDYYLQVCASVPVAETGARCNDGIDNDCDGLIDCDDDDCLPWAVTYSCPETTYLICNDGFDSDGDGGVDCADPECVDLDLAVNCVDCAALNGVEDCTDGVDNDSDGLVDCADPDCASCDEACQGTAVCPASIYSIKSQELQGDGMADVQLWIDGDAIRTYVYDYAEDIFTDTDADGLPLHPNDPTLTATINVLGFADYENIGRVSLENAQTDGWLIVPPGVDCTVFRMGGPRMDASSLYIGADIDNMHLVGRMSARRSFEDFNFQFDDADNYEEIIVPGCTEPYKIARFRLYHYDYHSYSKSVVQWNLDGRWEFIDGTSISSVANKPTADDVVETGKDFVMVDANGDLWQTDGTTPRPLNPRFCETLGDQIVQSAPACDCNPEDFNDTHLDWSASGFGHVTPVLPVATPITDAGDGMEFGPFEYEVTTTSFNADGANIEDIRVVGGNRIAFYNRYGDGEDDYYCLDLDFTSGPLNGVQFNLSNIYYDQIITVYGELNGEMVQPIITPPVLNTNWRSPEDFKLMRYNVSCEDPLAGGVESGLDEGTSYLIGSGYGGRAVHRMANIYFPTPIDNLTICRGGNRRAVVLMTDLLANVEDCTDGLDNDCDGLIDCADSDCVDSDMCNLDAELMDPCWCGNPSNILNTDGSIQLFKESIVITNDGNSDYQITSGMNIYDENGDPFTFPITMDNTYLNVDGDYVFMFYVNPNEEFSISAVDGLGTGVLLDGYCSDDNCDCFATEEICDDGIDNDRDGMVDENDGGNCEIDCATITSVEIEGKMLITDGQTTTQIWTTSTTPAACCAGAGGLNVPPVDVPSGMWDPASIPFNVPESNTNVFNHREGDGTLHPNVVSVGLYDFSNSGINSHAEQVQQDGWLVIPPGIDCVSFKLNGRVRAESSALYLGSDFANLDLAGAAWYVGGHNGNGGDVPYIIDVDVADLNATTVGCGWNVLRYRYYHHDTRGSSDSRVYWNIGDGFEVIPAKYLQSLGDVTSANTDGDTNKPDMEMDLPAYCAFQDGDGDLVTTDGEFFVLDPRKCEAIADNECLECAESFIMCDAENGLICVEEIIDSSGVVQDTFPSCNLEVFQVTPRVPDDGTLRTVLWDRNQTTVINNRDNWSVPFSTIADGTCPNCLPANDSTETATFEHTTLGVGDIDINGMDTDGDEFLPRRAGFRGAESVQQDGWILVPGHLSCLEFRLRNPSAYASALFLGSSIDEMTMVGEYNYGRRRSNNINQRRGEFSYVIPDDAPVVDTGCEEPMVALRVRFYHHDPSSYSNSQVRWNIGLGWQVIPAAYLRTAADECDDTPPADITYTEGTPYLAVKDGEGLWFAYGDTNDPNVPTTHSSPDDDADGGTGTGWPSTYEAPNGVDNEINLTFVGGCDQILSVCGGEVDVALDTRGLCQLCVIPGLAKTITNVSEAASNIEGNIDVTFKFTLANHGGAEMSNLEINDEIASLPGFVGITTTPMVTMVTAGATSPVPNDTYDGTGNLLDGMSGVLVDGEQIMVEVVVEIDASEVPNGTTNTATGGGTAPNGTISILDDSDNGIDPNANGEDEDTDEPTPLNYASISLAKNYAVVAPAASGVSGNADVTIHLIVENTGNVDLENITLVEDLVANFGTAFISVIASPSIITTNANTDPMLDAGFDGTGTTSVFDGTSGLLEPGQSVTIELIVELDVNAEGAETPLTNQASTSGEGSDPSGNGTVTVTDLSDSGTDPDGNNIGSPGDTGGPDDPTEFSVPSIGVAKDLVDVSPTGEQGNNNFNATFQFVITNSGNVQLENISLIDDLTVLGCAYLNMTETGVIVESSATEDPVVNTNYSGVAPNDDIFDGMSGVLLPGEEITVTIVIELDMSQDCVELPLVNQATVSGDGIGPDGSVIEVTDLSDNGPDPEGTNEGEPGDTGGGDDGTPIGHCWMQAIDAFACTGSVNLSVDDNCDIVFGPDMLLEGLDSECTGLSGSLFVSFFDVVITDQLGNTITVESDPMTGALSFSGADLLGETLNISVFSVANDLSCWGTVLIEDSSAPTQDDIDAACGAGGGDIPCDQVERYLDAANATLGKPSAFTVGCSTYDWQLHDIDFTSTNSGCEYEITRTFRTSWIDKTGAEGEAFCSRVFNSIPFDGTVTQPQEVVTLPCGSDLSPEAISALGLANGGGDARAYPKIGSTVLDLEGEVCGVRATYTDLPLDACAPGCAGTMKIVRTWKILDWCESLDGDEDNGVAEFVQVLKAIDEEAPTFTIHDITVGTNPWDCTGSFEIPEIMDLHDNCDSNPTYVGTTGPATVEGRSVVGAPMGVHEFNVSYTDCCGNIGTRTVTVTVVDNVGPVVSTVQDVVVSLTPGGSNPEDASSKLYWYHVDNQSYDACTDVTVEIRRPAGDPACNNVGSGGHNNNVTFNNDGHSDDNNRDTDGGQFVKFCCADLEAATVDVNGDGTNDEGYVEVIVRAYDALGNYNEAWSYVKVEDNAPPIISGPAAATIYCDWPIEDNFDSRTYTSRGSAAGSNKYVSADGVDFDKTNGVASGYGTCGATSIEYVDVIITTEGDGIDQCGAGQFTRIFRTVKTDKNGNAQVRHHFQKITILGRDGDADVTQDINNPAGVGPEDIGPFMVGCDGPSQADIDMYSPVVVGGDPCDVIGRATSIDTFFFEQGACKKWTVEYRFMNWCDNEEWNTFEPVTFMYIDTEKPVMTGCQDTMYAQNDVANCQHALELENSATDNGGCVGPENAWLKWQVYVDLWSDGTIDAYGSSYAFTGSWRKTNSANPFLPSNPNWSSDVWVVNVEATGSGEATDIPALPAELIQGNMSNHKVTWKVTDGCHNFASCSEEFMVVDKKAPTPYCRNLSTAVMNGSDMVELWAIDFNVDSEDNCTDKENLRYTFTDVKPQDDPLYDPTTRSSSRVFNCEDVPGGVYRMYVWDEKDNFDYCEVDLTVVDNDDSCDPIVEECQITEYTGWAVATCNAEAGTGGAVAVLHDIRNTGNAPSGEDWGPSITQVHPSNWTIDAIGQVFGIAIGEDENIYLAASDIYDTQQNSDPYGPGQIFIANANNGFEAEPFVELPNTGGALNGIGNIAYCTNNSMLYASNLEDGKIYRINSTGAIMESYDPWSSDDGSAGIVSQSEQVWGIGLNEESGSKKLYFARIGNGERSMYSIVLNSNGSFPSTGSETVAFGDIMGVGERISDIDFNTAGNKMIFTERGTFFTTGAHNSKMLGYELNNGTWSMELKYHIGALVSDVFPEFDVATGENAAGGVTFGATNVSSTGIEGEDEVVWSTANWFRKADGRLFYGMQGMSASGNNPHNATVDPNISTDMFVDFDGEYDNYNQKGDLGDLEIIGCSVGSTSNRGTISGTIATAGGQVVANITTTIAAVLPEYPRTDATNALGVYMFENNPMNVEYTLTAEKNTGLLEGVNTLDLVKIQRHLLGLELLNDPYKVIAADIDNDESIRPGDLLTLRKAILGLSSEFTNNTSWRFVDGSQSNDDLSLVNDYINTGESLTTDMMNEDFVAVKVGDVDGTVNGLLANGNIQSRSGNAITLVTDNKTVVAGELVEVTFTSEELNDVYGYQFTMDLQGLEFAGVTAGLLNMTESNVGVLNSAVTVSYNDVKAMNAGTAEGLFTMSFVATEAGELSEMISSTSSVTRAEAYVGENLETVGVEIAMRGANTAVAQYELLQNEPNPFKTTTTIGYTRPTAGSADFTVLDVTGKVLMSRKVTGVAGYNEVTINKGEINVSGVLYYTLSTGDFTDTKKMIMIE